MTRQASLLLTTLLLGLTAQPGHADADYERARRLMEAGTILPLETIVSKAQAVHPGRILEAELKEKHGGYYYEIELLDDAGRVWELSLDARTGRLLKKDREEKDD
jgi:uncharacterized membrane protein YkoI